MKRIIDWIWTRGILSTFLSGLFAVLPIVITVAIVSWVVSYLHSLLGSDTAIGRTLQSVGLQFVTDEATAFVIGWLVVLAGIWVLGLLVKSKVKDRASAWFGAVISRIPIIKGVYGTAAQVVGMLKKDEQTELKGMSVVFCSFGQQHGGGFLALLASPDIYRFGQQECRVVYIPTSPLPMSGGIVFVPVAAVTKIDMSADQLMQIYFSLGTLSSQAVPAQHHVPQMTAEP